MDVQSLLRLLEIGSSVAEFDTDLERHFVETETFRAVVEDRADVIAGDKGTDLLCRRIRGNREFLEACDIVGKDCAGVFAAIFPEQVDVGDRKPSTWTWIMGRIRDGNYVRPPRNLIDLVSKSQEAQLRREEKRSRIRVADEPLIESESIKRGLARLSAERVEDTLLAEAGAYAQVIERFRGGKAEHNLSTIASTLGIDVTEAEAEARKLTMLGFLESAGETYKVPMVYRDGLSITQGKAF